MIVFESQYEEGSPKVRVELSSDSSLVDVLQSFQDFLKATGFAFNGQVIIEEEDEIN